MAAQTGETGGQGRGTEGTDVRLRPILVFSIGLVVTIIVAYLIVTVLFRVFTSQATDRDTAAGVPEAQQQAATEDRLPPEPRIQVNPEADLKALRQREDAQLNSYGWVDQQAGTVHIPIEQAMKLVLEQGLPTRQPQSAAAADGTVASNASPVKGERKIP